MNERNEERERQSEMEYHRNRDNKAKRHVCISLLWFSKSENETETVRYTTCM